MLRPPVRAAFPGGATHPAAEVARTVVADGGAGRRTRCAQVLADEHGPPPGRRRRRGAGPVRSTSAASRRAPLELVVRGAAAGHRDRRGRGRAPRRATAGSSRSASTPASATCAPVREEERFESLDVIGTRHLHASVRTPDGAARARSWPWPSTTATGPGPRAPRSPARTPTLRADPRGRAAHGRPLRARRLRRLPDPGAAGLDRRLGGAPDGRPGRQPGLVDGPLAPAAGRGAAPRRDARRWPPASDFAADDRMIVPDWSLHWVRSVHNLYRYTGDRDLVAELLPVAERTLRWFESYLGADGLLARRDRAGCCSTGPASTRRAARRR